MSKKGERGADGTAAQDGGAEGWEESAGSLLSANKIVLILLLEPPPSRGECRQTVKREGL